MVDRKTDQRNSVKTSSESKFVLLGIILILTATIVLVSCFAIKSLIQKDEPELVPTVAPTPEPEPEPEPEPKKEYRAIDFQPIVDDWVSSVGGNRSVLIYDIERDETVGEYNADESYNTASLYKLFVVYEGYRLVQSGEWDGDEVIVSGMNIVECLDKAIRESYSPCAETLWGMIGRDELDTIIENDFQITNSDISSLVSNPRDILKIMKIFYNHAEITDQNLIATMKDSFLVQPITTYDWRQGLPSGFDRANVYNKVGWDYNPDGGYWNIYHDAAIVVFPEEERHFIVVVMTNRVSFQNIRNFGAMIEEAFYK